MYWLRRPAWLRWVAVALLLTGATYLDLRPASTVPYPFAAAAIEAGSPIEDGAVTWREVPRGLLPATDLAGAIAGHDVAAGDPLLPSVVRRTAPLPADWWAVPVPLPEQAVPGSPLRAVMHAGAEVADGVVMAAPSPDDYETTGLAAFPREAAVRVAAATMTSDVVVLLAP